MREREKIQSNSWKCKKSNNKAEEEVMFGGEKLIKRGEKLIRRYEDLKREKKG